MQDGELAALLGVIVVGFMVAHTVLERLQTRFFFSTGVEFLLLGALLGPNAVALLEGLGVSGVSPVLSLERLQTFSPLMALAVGWVGLLVGAELNLGRLFGRNDEAIGVSAITSALVFLGVLGGVLGALALWPPGAALALRERLLLGCTLGAIAATTTPVALSALQRRYNADGPTTDVLKRALGLDELLAILGFGAIFCVFHGDSAQAVRALTATEWFVLSIGLGGVLGGLFHLLIRDEERDGARWFLFVGIVMFASGAAWWLSLSPLLVNLVLGLTMVNVSDRASDAIVDVLHRTAQPMHILLLLFAGALWSAPSWAGVGLGVVFALVRAGLVMVAGGVAGAFSGAGVRRDLGRAMLGQGPLAVAMALNFALAFPQAPLGAELYTAALVAVLLNELWSSRSLRGLLIDAGDLRSITPTSVAQAGEA